MSSKRKTLLPKEILIENISKLVKLNKLDLTDMKLFPLKKKRIGVGDQTQSSRSKFFDFQILWK